MEISTVFKNDLLSAIRSRYGYDFTNYSEASIKRRISRFADKHEVGAVFDLKHHLINSDEFFSDFLHEVTVNVTEMFRDPMFFRVLREKIFPVLNTYPHVRIWHAGCSTGEEVYSMAIMLHEEMMHCKTTLYATDLNTDSLQQAKEGIYPLKFMKEYTANYIAAGGKNAFSDYYTARYDEAIFNERLRKNITFSVHNLASDSSFNEFHLIICRNVLIYFNRELQERVFYLFSESLAPLGFLALGSKETLHHSKMMKSFEATDQKEKIYRKIDGN